MSGEPVIVDRIHSLDQGGVPLFVRDALSVLDVRIRPEMVVGLPVDLVDVDSGVGQLIKGAQLVLEMIWRVFYR